MDDFQQFQIIISEQQKESYMDAFENVVPAIWENDAGQVIGLWQESEEDLSKKLEPILVAYNLDMPKIIFSHLENRDWLKENQSSLPPLEIGRFFISSGEVKEEKMSIILDATSAFGSGHHSTTAGCVKALDKLNFSPKNALDVGTGSGVLAICIENLWNIPIIACDNNPHCVDVTLENIKRNKCHMISCIESDGLLNPEIDKQKPYDLIIANILTEPLCQIAAQIKHALSKNGLFICSGVLLEQVPKLEKAYKEQGLTLKQLDEEGEWAISYFVHSL